MGTTGPDFRQTFHNQNQGLSTYIQILVTYLFFGLFHQVTIWNIYELIFRLKFNNLLTNTTCSIESILMP